MKRLKTINVDLIMSIRPFVHSHRVLPEYVRLHQVASLKSPQAVRTGELGLSAALVLVVPFHVPERRELGSALATSKLVLLIAFRRFCRGRSSCSLPMLLTHNWLGMSNWRLLLLWQCYLLAVMVVLLLLIGTPIPGRHNYNVVRGGAGRRRFAANDKLVHGIVHGGGGIGGGEVSAR